MGYVIFDAWRRKRYLFLYVVDMMFFKPRFICSCVRDNHAIYRHHIVEIHFALPYFTIAWTRTSFLSGRGLTFAAWVLSADCRVVIELEGLFQEGGAGLSF